MKTYTLIIVALLLVGGGIYAYSRTNDAVDENAVICTMDAKMCPDGSYVGRTGPNCEFAACPTGNGQIINASGTIDFEGNVQ